MGAYFFLKTTLAAVLAMAAASHAISGDHQEFDATLQAPFRADSGGGRNLTLRFAQQTGQVRWRLDLLAPSDNTVIRRWHGERLLDDAAQPATVTLRWQASAATPPGIYRLRLRASLDGAQHTEQIWPVAVGPAPPPAIAPLIAAPSPEAAPYDIYLGNLHSQTGHSDGGGALGQCSGAQAPQSAPLGPSDAYAYAQRRHLDFLMTSEHNHMYDGSDGTNASADAAAARALFHNGRH